MSKYSSVSSPSGGGAPPPLELLLFVVFDSNSFKVKPLRFRDGNPSPGVEGEEEPVNQ